MYAPIKGRVVGGGMASSGNGPHLSGLAVRFQTNSPFETLAAAPNTGSDGSDSTASLSSSGGSLSQLGPNQATGGSTTSSRGQVDSQQPQATQLPTTPQRARRMAASGSSNTPSIVSPSAARTHIPQQYEGSPQKIKATKISQLQGLDMQRRNSHASQASENWRSPRRPSFSSSLRSPTMLNPVDVLQTASMSGVPEYLAVQEMAFRQGQHDCNGSRNRVPPSPFGKHFDHVWAQYYKLGAVYGGGPTAMPPAASSPSHENFAWPVLINSATQDLEHPNGSFDIEWTRKVCTMALNCMKELIRVVCRRLNDWRKIVCDIPAPVKHAIVAFPELCEYYEILRRDAHEALSGGAPLGYEAKL
ncbi:hypothetical protein DDE82_003746 [Stemphylium lycopersici]|nr:hypothetical protein DDE82_003746 [Stemphylium lycopersici]